MSEQSGIIKGLKDQECEKGAISRRPPIAYVPVINEIQEQLNNSLSGKRTEKLTTPDGVTFHVGIWFSGTAEQFLLHVKQAMHSVKRAGLVDEYYSAREKRINAHKEWDKTVSAIVKYEKDNKENGPYRNAEAVLKELKEERDALLEAQTEAEAERVVLADSIFTQYANLLSVEQRGAWEKIVEQKVDISGWTDLRGRKHTKKRGKTYKHFLECTVFHLQTVFDEDATECQQIYISSQLKKPQRVSVRAFFTRVEQLNNYVKYLPSIYNSPKATESTQLAVPYTEGQLAVQLLCMCPVHWQNQYDLNQNTIPQDTRRLLAALENIEKLSTSSTVPKSPSNGNTGGNAKPNGNPEKGGKHKNGNSFADKIPKKARAEKHCNLCQKHGGTASTLSTSECTKYEKDGTLKAEWGKKGPFKTTPKTKTVGGNAFAQLAERMAKLEKSVKKSTKSSSRKKKRHYDSSGSDSE
jgi:hypothetical protein